MNEEIVIPLVLDGNSVLAGLEEIKEQMHQKSKAARATEIDIQQVLTLVAKRPRNTRKI